MTDKEIDNIIGGLRVVSLGPSKAKAVQEPPYIFCDTQTELDILSKHIGSVTKSSSLEDKSPVYLDCEGRDLGRISGKLGLVQLSIEDKIYLVDVIAFPENIATLKDILENPVLEKVVWDGRMDYSELWHGHGISVNPVLDLQLVRIYRVCDGRAGGSGFIKLEAMSRVFENIDYRLRQESGIDVSKLTRVHEQVKAKHKRDETEFWIERPLSRDLQDYASFDIMQLKVLYKAYRGEIAKRPHIAQESKRYVEMFKEDRPVKGGTYTEHGLLPQEILERSEGVKVRNDKLGTRNCDGCGRDLHQDSFLQSFAVRSSTRLCHTCRERKRFISYRRW